jgi:peptide/nickel transport system substrate-binding protein
VEFGVLGPVEARRDGRELLLGGPKQRALLAILLLHANEVVSRDRLIDGLWGERPPATAAHTLDNYVSRVRKALGAGRLVRRAPGYLLCVEPGELDLDRFEQLFRQGREALARGDADVASEAQRAALELWRGAALADVLDEPFAQAESGRLEERRLLALEERIEADLALGAGSAVVPELETLVREQPFRDRPLGQLMLALYRAGRQGEALAAFQAGRQRLVGDLGLEPSPQLGELQRKILEHDPSLAAPGLQSGVEPPERPRRNRRKAVAIGAAAAVVAGAVSLGIVLGTGGTTASSRGAAAARVVGLNSSSGAVADSVPLPGNPASIAAGYGSLWLADPNAGAVVRVDLDSQAVTDRIPVGGSPGTLAVGGGSVWVASVPEGGMSRIDPETGEVTQRLELGVDVSALAFGGRALWIADATDNSLLEIDPASGTIRRTVALQVRPTALAIGGETIWVAGYGANSISEVELRSGQTVATISVGNGPAALAVGDRALWVVNALDSTVSRIDPTAGSIVATVPVGSGPTAVAVAGGSVWVTNQNSGTVSRIDPGRNTVVGTSVVGGGPTTAASVDDKVWVGARPSIERRGGTLRLLSARPISIDPALQLALGPLQSDGLTRDGLVTYNHVPGPAGTQLVPDLAIRLPAPTEGGTVYTFRLRPGILYSDGRPVQAADFRRAIERVFRQRSDGRDLFAGIVGAAECARPEAVTCDLSRGIVTDERSRTVTLRLVAPDPDFMAKLAYGGLATPVPGGTPFRDTGFTPIPGTGPYKIAAASEREIRYVRNPLFREWSHAAQPDGNPDEIVMRFGLSPDQEISAIQQGRADWAADNVPARLLPLLRTQFPGQLHTNPTTETDFFKLNTTLPPFDDARARRALNLAIDRREVVRIYGGSEAAVSTCQVLPAGIPGYRRYCPYTLRPDSGGAWTAPDVERAQRLVAASGTRGAHVTVWGWTDDSTISPRVVHYTARVLRRLGYRVRVRLVSHASFDQLPAEVRRTVQLIPAGWLDTTAYNFFAPWLSCGGAMNRGNFCDRRIDRAMKHARSLEAANPRAAASVWASVDRALVDQAAWVPLVNPRLIDFVSARVRNYQHHPYWGILADQLWLSKRA